MREYELVATKTGSHYLLLGLDNSELCGFRLQMWITHYNPRAVDWAQKMGLNFCSFLGGDVWVHNDETADRCNLFGEKRDCIIGVVSNEQPLTIKLYDSLGVHSDDSWEVTSITIPATSNYPDGMSSRIPLEQFKKRKGVWEAKFLRNMKSTDSTSRVLDALRGEPLKGYELYMTLKNTNTEQVKLFKVTTNMTVAR